MASQVDERDRPFDPKRAPTWRGSRSDLVVNPGHGTGKLGRPLLLPKEEEQVLRYVDVDGYKLLTWELWPPQRYQTGQEKIGYAFWDPQGKLLFNGDDVGLPPSQTSDGDDSLRSVLGWLTLRPGDTDDEYFEKYTPEQMAFAEGDAEMLSIWGMEPQSDDEYPPPEFKDIKWSGPPARARGHKRNSSTKSWDEINPRPTATEATFYPSTRTPSTWYMGVPTADQIAGAKFTGKRNGEDVFVTRDGLQFSQSEGLTRNGHRRNPPVDRRDVPHNLRGIEPRRYSDAEMPTENGDSLRYEQTDNCDDDDCEWFIVGETEGGDYSGGTVARSNYRKLEEMLTEAYPDSTPAVWGTLRGSHGSQSIIVKYGDLDDEIRGVIDALADYPLIDEEDHSELEHTEEEEYWNSSYGGRKDFCKDLGKALGMRWADELQEKLDDAIWDQVFEAAREDANVYWEHSSSEGPYIDMKRVIKSTVKILENDKLPVEIEPFEAYEALRKVIANLTPEE
jgi:hypothetical protein